MTADRQPTALLRGSLGQEAAWHHPLRGHRRAKCGPPDEYVRPPHEGGHLISGGLACYPGFIMSGSCPDCGAEVEFTTRPAQLRVGACSACGHSFALFEDPSGTSPGAVSGLIATSVPGATPPSPAEASGGAIPCPQCEGSLTLRASGEGRIVGVCADCEAETVFTVETGEEEEAEEPRARRGPPARGRFSGGGMDRGEGPRSRPCRECGAPLRFSTNPDGTVQGECTSCGNRFTLPPRTYDRGGGGGFRGRFGPRGGSDRGGRFPRGSGGRFGRGPPPYARRRPPREDEGEERDDRRRRRRNDDE